MWLLSRLSLPLRRLCFPPAVRWLPGLARRWAFPSARPPARCLAWWRSCGLLPPPPLAASPRRGRGACPVRVAAAWCAPFRSPLAWRRRGRFPFRWPRRPFRWVAVAPPALWPPWLPLVAPWALSRAGAFGCVRRRLAGGVSRLARAGFAGRAVCGVPLPLRGGGGWPPRSLVWLAGPRVRPARPWLARRGGAPAGPAPVSGFAPLGRVCPRRRSRSPRFAPPCPSARWRCAPRPAFPRPAPALVVAVLVTPLAALRGGFFVRK